MTVNGDAGERNDRSEKEARDRAETDYLQQFQRLERPRKTSLRKKNLTNEPWEFGYAVGISRPPLAGSQPNRLHLLQRKTSRLGAENVWRNSETATASACPDTSHYLAPVASLRNSGGDDL